MKKWLFWIYPLGWMAIIFYASSQPYQDQNLKPLLGKYVDLSFLDPYIDWISFHYHSAEVSVEQLGTEGFIEFFIRKGAHVGVYTVLFLLLCLALIKTFSLSRSNLVAVAFITSLLYACSDELHQGITPNRTPYVGDVVLDCFGMVIGMLILWLARFSRLQRRRAGYH